MELREDLCLLGVEPSQREPSVLQLGPMSVDFQLFVVRSDNVVVRLTKAEFDLLAYLMMNAHRVVAASELVQAVSRGSYCDQPSLIRVHITHLRKKLGARSSLIVTVRSRGFRFCASAA